MNSIDYKNVSFEIEIEEAKSLNKEANVNVQIEENCCKAGCYEFLKVTFLCCICACIWNRLD
jgi:hypothetical protein